MSQIVKSYVTSTVETRALSSIDLHVAEGEFVALTGPSGSGKTTLLNVAGLLESPDSGTYTLNGKDVSSLNDRQRSQCRSELIGFIFQGFNLLPDLSVIDNIELPLRIRGMKASERRAQSTKALATVGLSNRAQHFPAQLSGGQQQRVAIARAIAGEPKLILADEPTGNLDSGMSEQIMGLLHEINQSGTTIMMVTHDVEHAKKAARRVVIRDGKLQEDLSKSDNASAASKRPAAAAPRSNAAVELA
nr:ABC transporter ATP-binding protein [Ahniella affigens]